LAGGCRISFVVPGSKCLIIATGPAHTLTLELQKRFVRAEQNGFWCRHNAGPSGWPEDFFVSNPNPRLSINVLRKISDFFAGTRDARS
jgi:hypothetical protein